MAGYGSLPAGEAATRPMTPSSSVPSVGVSGPKALRALGERADGTVLSVLGGVEYVAWAAAQALGSAAELPRALPGQHLALGPDDRANRENRLPPPRPAAPAGHGGNILGDPKDRHDQENTPEREIGPITWEPFGEAGELGPARTIQ